MIKSNVRSYELVKAINDEQVTIVDAPGTSTLAGIRTGVLTSAIYNDIVLDANTDGKSTQAFIRKEDILEAATKYTTTKVWVYLDQEGAIKFYQEFVSNVQDIVEITFSKYFSDLAEIQEFEFIDFLKAIEEEIIVLELFESFSNKLLLDTASVIDDSILELEKQVIDNADVLEDIGIDLARPLVDAEIIEESAAISVETGFSNTTESSDSNVLSVAKSITENQPQSDSLNRTVDYNRSYTDSVIPLDTIAGFAFTDEESDSVAIDPVGIDDDPVFNLDKAPISDTLSNTDSSVFEFTKRSNEIIVPIEVYQQELSKIVLDSVGLVDYEYAIFEKVTDENVNQYDEVTVLIEWSREFDDYLESTDVYSSLFEMGYAEDDVVSEDIFDRTVTYNREFVDTQTVTDQLSSVGFDDEESDSVVADPLGIDDDPAFDLQKAPIDISVSNTDLAIFAVEKITNEQQYTIDDIDSFSFDKSIENNQLIEDLIALGFSTSNLDQFAVTDSYAQVIDFNRDFLESVSNLDDNVFSIDKVLEDIQTIPDDVSIGFVRPDIADRYSSTDSFSRTVDYQRTADDIVTLSDSLSGIAFLDEESDSVAFDPFHVDDDPAFTLDKPLSEQYFGIDNYSAETTLPKQETQAQTDSISAINTDKVLGETQTQTEQQSVDFSKGQIQESVTEVDYFERTTSYSRQYTETQAQSDSNSIDFAKGTIQETVSETDSRIIQSYKYFYETMSESDSGTLLNTDYVGSYYFNDDFVGSKRTF